MDNHFTHHQWQLVVKIMSALQNKLIIFLKILFNTPDVRRQNHTPAEKECSWYWNHKSKHIVKPIKTKTFHGLSIKNNHIINYTCYEEQLSTSDLFPITSNFVLADFTILSWTFILNFILYVQFVSPTDFCLIFKLGVGLLNCFNWNFSS